MQSFPFSAVISGIRTKFSSVDQLSTDQLASLRDEEKKILILDTRPAQEFAVSHLESAVRVDRDSDAGIAAAMAAVKEQQPDAVVCYCSVGYRSSDFAAKLKQQDESVSCPVYNLEGSLFKWANEDRPMVNGRGEPTPFAHPFNALWGKLLRKELRQTEVPPALEVTPPSP